MADFLNDLSTYPILRVGPDWNNSLQGQFQLSRKVFRFKGTVDSFLVYDPERPFAVDLEFYLLDKEDEFNFLTFFEDKKGRWSRFWFPAPFTFFNLSDPVAINTNLVVCNDNLFYNRFRGHERLLIELENGDFITMKLTAVNAGPGLNELTLTTSTNFDRNITAEEIRKISFIYLGRFDIDDMTVQYKSDQAGIVKQKFFELIKEYP